MLLLRNIKTNIIPQQTSHSPLLTCPYLSLIEKRIPFVIDYSHHTSLIRLALVSLLFIITKIQDFQKLLKVGIGSRFCQVSFAEVYQYSVFCNFRPLKEGNAIQNYQVSINFAANWFF
jgi:hypothetical protein